MLYTRTGDSGMSGLYGSSERLPKDSPLYEALGALDELNSLLGVCYATVRKKNSLSYSTAVLVRTVQQHLFVAQAELAGADKFITQRQVDWMEEMIGQLEGEIENPHAFVISGATEVSALFDYARTVARRTERAVLRARAVRELSGAAYAYLNRLSSFLYALARRAAAAAGAEESSPSYL